jgi:hypothetical protein
MSFSIRPLLVHCQGIPAQLRAAVRATLGTPAGLRSDELESVAALLRLTTGLNIEDARELLDLPPSQKRPASREEHAFVRGGHGCLSQRTSAR